MTLDYDRDQELIMRLNAADKGRDAANQFQMLAWTICFDGKVSDTELDMLVHFLGTNAHLSSAWPYNRVWDLLARIRQDGDVTHEGRLLLLRTLKEFERGVPTPTGAAFDDDVEVVIDGRRFCITGVLEFGQRRHFQERLEACGGIVQKSVSSKTDFLVVGMKGSAAWMSDRYGTKIDEVMQYRERWQVRVIRESFAVEALLLAEDAKR